MRTEPQHKTNILPLRWFANACNHIAHYPLHKALYHEDYARYHELDYLSKRGHFWWKMYELINKPYDRWGTTYLVLDWYINEDNEDTEETTD